ncbi:MAG TPA: MoxR family ATPase, partial [Sporichthya sp.]|nr:MoxR family ATPase [Sporichthya sp.]
SSAIYDRVCRITMGYQDAADEFDIVKLRAPAGSAVWRAKVVDLVRRTREHAEIRVGSSVRGAIDMSRLADALARRRGLDAENWHVGLDAALVALSGRIRLAESTGRVAEDVVRELYVAVFGAEPRSAEDGDAPGGA